MFHAAGGRRLEPRARAHFDACERQQAIVYVPAAVIWECSLLARAVRINLRRTVREFFDDLFSHPAYQPVDLTLTQIDDAAAHHARRSILELAAVLDRTGPSSSFNQDVV